MQPLKIFKNQKCIALVGIVLITLGTVLLATCSRLINYLIDREVVLAPNKNTYELWKKTPMPVTMEFYFFNWLNPQDLRNTSVKPRLEEKGPYVFREIKEKVDIVWNKNGTVSFRQLRRWYFDEKKSNGSLSDEITTINPVSVAASSQAQKFNYVMQKGFSISMSTLISDVYITRTVGEFLFDGYQDTMIDFARTMPVVPGVELPPMEQFAWFYKRNGSTLFDGLITMGTGTSDVPFGMIDRWNYKQETGFYPGTCGKVHGSAGEFWEPNLTKDDIYMFSPDMCTSVGFQFEKEETVKGITGYRYIGGEKTMENGTKYPENLCYCGGECVPSGLINVTSCRYGAPGFISFPHFYVADPYYAKQFEGLNPNREEHELSITLEPRTGIPLSVSAKLQVNLLLTPISGIGLYSDVPRLFFPMLWFNQDITLPDDLASSVKLLVDLPLISEIFAIVLLVLGFAIIVTLLIIYFHRKIQAYQRNKQLQTARLARESVPLNDNGGRNSVAIKALDGNKKMNGYSDT